MTVAKAIPQDLIPSLLAVSLYMYFIAYSREIDHLVRQHAHPDRLR